MGHQRRSCSSFITEFNTICSDNKLIVNECLDNVEQGLHNKENKKQLNTEISSTEMKINKLLDLHLEGKVDRIAYEEKYEQLRNTLTDLQTESIALDNVVDDKKVLSTIRQPTLSASHSLQRPQPLENSRRRLLAGFL